MMWSFSKTALLFIFSLLSTISHCYGSDITGTNQALSIPDLVGDHTDYTAVVSGGVTYAEGSFSSEVGVVSEYDSKSGIPNVYSIQMNTNRFKPAYGDCATIATCSIVEQFAYIPRIGEMLVQYWALDVGPSIKFCPRFTDLAWQYVAATRSCYASYASDDILPVVSITDLKSIYFIVNPFAGSETSFTIYIGAHMYSMSAPDYFGIYLYWNSVEFNIFGDHGRSEAIFNTGSSLGVSITATGSAPVPAQCSKQQSGETAETNNLVLGKCIQAGTSSIQFMESN